MAAQVAKAMHHGLPLPASTSGFAANMGQIIRSGSDFVDTLSRVNDNPRRLRSDWEEGGVLSGHQGLIRLLDYWRDHRSIAGHRLEGEGVGIAIVDSGADAADFAISGCLTRRYRVIDQRVREVHELDDPTGNGTRACRTIVEPESGIAQKARLAVYRIRQMRPMSSMLVTYSPP